MFWSLALLLLPEHAAAQERVLQELETAAASIREQQQQQQPVEQQPPVVQQQPQGMSTPFCNSSSSSSMDDATFAAMLQLALDKRSWVSRCVAEAIRLRLHSIAGTPCGDREGCSGAAAAASVSATALSDKVM
jgi:hypothetical protein